MEELLSLSGGLGDLESEERTNTIYLILYTPGAGFQLVPLDGF